MRTQPLQILITRGRIDRCRTVRHWVPLLLDYRGPMPPPVFVSYRRVDEPFAAALMFALLADRWDGDPVFLDTRFLRQRGDFGPQLLDAVAKSELVLAVVGRAWDETDCRIRLADPNDWVRRELIAAAQTGKPVVPVLVDREDVPTELPFEPVPEWSDPISPGLLRLLAHRRDGGGTSGDDPLLHPTGMQPRHQN
jgi:hypothetical protein